MTGDGDARLNDPEAARPLDGAAVVHHGGSPPLAQATIVGSGAISPESPLPSRLLVFSRTTAYRHASIEAGVATVRELCAARVLAKVDESSYVGGTMGDDHPIVWCHDHEGGRSFYTAMGHTEASFAEVAFREHLRGAVRWAFHRS